jgi:hypothetical protein
MHLNIQCIRNIVNEFEILIDRHSLEIVYVCEHWLTTGELANFAIPGSYVADSYCPNTHKNGGEAIFLRDHLASKSGQLPFNHLVEDKTLECACVSLITLVNTIFAQEVH